MTTIKNDPFVLNRIAIVHPITLPPATAPANNITQAFDRFEQDSLRTWQTFLNGESKKQPINPGWKAAAAQILAEHNLGKISAIPQDITVHQESLHALLRIVGESKMHIVAHS